MYCSYCGAPNPEGSEACTSCGVRLFSADPPSSIPSGLRPMGVGDMFDEMIRLFRQNFRTFIGIVAVLEVPILILQTIQAAIVGPVFQNIATNPAAVESQWGLFAFWGLSTLVLAVIMGLAYLVIQAALASAISQRYLGRQITVGGAYRVALACFWRMFGMALVTGVALGLIAMTIIGIPLAIYLGIRWSLIVQAIALEGKGIGQGMSRSSNLVSGGWWRTFGILLVGAIAQYIVAGAPSAIIEYLIALFGISFFPSAALAVTTALGGVFNILAYPMIPIVITLVYYDLRIRKEGFDLQMMAEMPGQYATGRGEL